MKARSKKRDVVFITGATGDIGRAVAHAFASMGSNLAICGGKKISAAESLSREITSTYQVKCFAYGFDALSPQLEFTLKAIRANVNGQLGAVSKVICLAGLKADAQNWSVPFEKLENDLVLNAFQVDVLSSLAVAKVFKNDLVETKGSLTLMSSSAAIYGDTVGLAFAIAKSANAGLTKTLARVFAPHVRVNAVAPGALESEWSKKLDAKARKKARAQSIMNSLGDPESVASLIVELSTNTFMSGQVVAVDGGMFPPSP